MPRDSLVRRRGGHWRSGWDESGEPRLSRRGSSRRSEWARAISRAAGQRPLTWDLEAQIRGCAYFVAERGGPATTQQAASPAGSGDNPAIASYRFRALKVPPMRQCLRQGCRSGGERELRTISVAKLEPLETALVNEARLRSIGCVVD